MEAHSVPRLHRRPKRGSAESNFSASDAEYVKNLTQRQIRWLTAQLTTKAVSFGKRARTSWDISPWTKFTMDGRSGLWTLREHFQNRSSASLAMSRDGSFPRPRQLYAVQRRFVG